MPLPLRAPTPYHFRWEQHERGDWAWISRKGWSASIWEEPGVFRINTGPGKPVSTSRKSQEVGGGSTLPPSPVLPLSSSPPLSVFLCASRVSPLVTAPPPHLSGGTTSPLLLPLQLQPAGTELGDLGSLLPATDLQLSLEHDRKDQGRRQAGEQGAWHARPPRPCPADGDSRPRSGVKGLRRSRVSVRLLSAAGPAPSLGSRLRTAGGAGQGPRQLWPGAALPGLRPRVAERWQQESPPVRRTAIMITAVPFASSEPIRVCQVLSDS